MARRWLISSGSNALEAHTAKIAIDGVVKPILKACVAENGIVRQFFPPAPGTQGDHRILWSTTALTVTESIQAPLDAFAKIIFNSVLGTYVYDNFPNADTGGLYLNSPVTGAGQYLIKVDQVSGTALTGTLGSWIDIYSALEHTWSLDQTSVGSLAANANISISQDDGLGAPVLSTTVVKNVTFDSIVTAGNPLVWSELARALVEEKESVDADCILTFNPDGYASGSADTSGSFNENWHDQSPAAPSPGDFTVNVALVSGTAPTGSALATNLTLDQVREWILLATQGEDLSCALDVTVSDGVTPTTKRVTMNSVRSAASATPVWTTDEWTLTDAAFPQAKALLVDTTITFKTDGTATGRIDNNSGGEEQESGVWLPGGEDKADYEVRLTNIAGASGLISHTDSTWYNLNTEQAFIIEYTTRTKLKTYQYTADVRKIGDLAVSKTITINVSGDDGSTPP